MKLESIVTSVVGAAGIGGVSPLFAQMAASEAAVGTASWLSVVIQTGSLGLIGYLIIYGLPKLHEAMIAERKAERDRFTDALNRIGEERRLERVEFYGALKEQREAHTQEQRETRIANARELAELRKLFNDTIGAFRTAVHDVKDVASTTVNKANTAIELSKITGQTPQT